MNKEVKDVLQMLAMVLPVFGLMVIGWLCSPMYAEIKAQQQLAAQHSLLRNIIYSGTPARFVEITTENGTVIEILPHPGGLK